MDEALTLVSLGAGIFGNLATGVVQSYLSRLGENGVRELLARTGIIDLSFEQRLHDAISEGFSRFFEENPSCNIQEFRDFLEDTSVIEEIAASFAELRSFDFDSLKQHLSNYVGVELRHSPEGWPNEIDASLAIESLYRNLRASITASDGPGLLPLAIDIAEIKSGLDGLSSSAKHHYDDILHSVKTQPQIEREKAFRDFETSYLDHVRTRSSKLTTPGARDLHGVNQDLNVAYISLHLKSRGSAEGVRAESFLAENPQLSIRGPAGSGKTTLLNWLTVQCDPGSKLAGISGSVPFIIPLRRVARLEAGPPIVANFLRYATDDRLWVTPAPDGWLEQILKIDQRGIIMIDGVDELPRGRREEFWDWLEAFCEEYEGNRVIVTSRTLPGTTDKPTAAGWNPPSSFADAQLVEMSDADISAFVEHWHDSVDLSKLDDQDRMRLRAAKKSLPDKLGDPANRRIRELCSTPLLCAMVCVLHWREEGYLPRYRVELYEKCCEMLVEARDTKRDIQPPSGALAAMTKHDKDMVLQQLAFEMMQNTPDDDDVEDNASYRIEISREKATQWITSKIRSFQAEAARTADPTEVLDFLIERTGLLREPATGLIDFPHRTFQEYLAACAAGAESREDFLAKQASDDQWHETIMLAAGTTTGGVAFGRRLIEALLKRAERFKSSKAFSVRQKKTCLALALGALDNLRQHDPDLRERVLSYIGELVPPQNEVDAKILSVAGDAAVSYLGYETHRDEPESVVAACARALRLIGTTNAINSLRAGYVNETRPSIIAEVCASQSIRYSEIPAVMTEVSSTGKLPDYASARDLSVVQGLVELKELSIGKGFSNPESLASLTSLERVSAESVSGQDLSDILYANTIKTLYLSRVSIGALEWIKTFSHLRRLVFYIPDGDIDIDAFDGLQDLVYLAVHSGSLINCQSLTRLGSLKSISLSDTRVIGDIEALSSLSLENLSLESVEYVEPLASFVSSQQELTGLILQGMPELTRALNWHYPLLRELNVSHDESIQDLGSFSALTSLEELEVIGLERLISTSPVGGLKSLRRLTISYADALSSLPLGEFAGLESLALGHAPGIVDVGDIASLSSLKALEIHNCMRLADLFSGSTSLETIRLRGLPRLRDLAGLRKCPQLRTVELINCGSLTDLGPVYENETLEHLSLRYVAGAADVAQIAGMRRLRSLEMVGLHHEIDLQPFVGHPTIESIKLGEFEPESIFIPDPLRGLVSMSPYSHVSDRIYYPRVMVNARTPAGALYRRAYLNRALSS